MAATYDLGILGGGQLARMTAMAAQRMGLSVLTLDPGEETPAGAIADALQGSLSDPHALAALFSACERVTLENEFVPASAVREGVALAGFDPADLVPSVDALERVQDKLVQRQAYAAAGVPGPRFMPLEEATEAGVAKARFGGYDGKGVRMTDDPASLGMEPGTWMWEERVPFARELSVMVVLQDGRAALSDPVVTEQDANAVCDVTYPAEGPCAEARRVAEAAARVFGSDGLFGVELFELADGRILVNETAPRPHNTGHWTMEGGCSQFEQHVRVALGMPVDPVFANAPWTMANILGAPASGEWRDGLWAVLALDPEARVHWYAKSDPRPGRKTGHLNIPGRDPERARRARAAFTGA